MAANASVTVRNQVEGARRTDTRPSQSVFSSSATELARRLRRRDISARELVEATIARATKVEPVVRAIVRERYDIARQEAALADERLAREDPATLPPFLGVPCTIKESLALEGMPYTAGLVSRRGFVAERDGTATARLRAAGFIPIGVTNLSELGMWMESRNQLYGTTNNPYDPTRTAGGSSGGEGAIVGAGVVPVGLAADIGGSIRMPAFFNGVFGHKPTGGLVPITGQYPEPENEARTFLGIGPIARRAEDLFPFLSLIAGPDTVDRHCAPFSLGAPSSVRIEGLSVVHVESNGLIPVSADLRAAQRRALAYLESRGARVREARIEALRHSLEIWTSMMNAAAETPFSVLLGGGRPVRVGPALLRWLFGRSPHTLPALGLVLFEQLPKLLDRRAQRMIALGRELRATLQELLGDDGVMLYPPYASPAPRHGWALVPPVCWVYTGIVNVMGMPATQVPMGLNAKGLPLGVQVVSAPGNDHVTIAVAQELEAAFGGWVPPPKLP